MANPEVCSTCGAVWGVRSKTMADREVPDELTVARKRIMSLERSVSRLRGERAELLRTIADLQEKLEQAGTPVPFPHRFVAGDR